MTILTYVLQAAQGGSGQGSGAGASMWIMLIVIFLIMWLFMIRPQRKQQKELEKFRSELKKGDKVVTAGGIHGVVDQIDDTTVLLKVDGEVKLRVDKASLTRDMSDTQAKPQSK